MEKSEEFKKVVDSIKQLEQQLLSIDEGMKKNETCGEETEMKIEDHFAMCMNTLAARKERLLRELGKHIENHNSSLADAHQNVNKAIQMRRKILETGSFVYTTDSETAEHIWKGIGSLPNPHVPTQCIDIELSFQLLQSIQNHGRVVLMNLSKADPPDDQIPPCRYDTASSSPGYVDIKGHKSKFKQPKGIEWNPNDSCLYVCDSGNNAIRKIDQQGEVYTFQRDGLLSWPVAIAIHHETNTFFVICGGTNTIVKLTSEGVMSAYAGSGKKGYTDGCGPNASFNCPMGIAIDQQTSTMYIADSDNRCIRVVTPQREVSTLTRSRTKGYINDPRGIHFDERNQSLLVCDSGSNMLLRVLLNGEVLIVCDVPSPLAAITTNRTSSLSLSSSILISSRLNKLFMFTREGGVSELHQQEKEDGARKKLSHIFKNPTGLTVDEGSHSCFVAEFGACIITKVTFQSY